MAGQFVTDCEDFLRRSLPDVPVKVTGGPYRAYDVNVIQDGEHYVVDVYTSMRGNPTRVREALAYAVHTILSHHLG